MKVRLVAFLVISVFCTGALRVCAENDEDILLGLEWVTICHKGAEGWNKPGWGRPDWQCLYEECAVMWEVALSGMFQTKTGSTYKEYVTRKDYVSYAWTYTTTHKNVYFNDLKTYRVWSLEYVKRTFIFFILPGGYVYPDTTEAVQVSAKASRKGRVVTTSSPKHGSCTFVFKPAASEA